MSKWANGIRLRPLTDTWGGTRPGNKFGILQGKQWEKRDVILGLPFDIDVVINISPDSTSISPATSNKRSMARTFFNLAPHRNVWMQCYVCGLLPRCHYKSSPERKWCNIHGIVTSNNWEAYRLAFLVTRIARYLTVSWLFQSKKLSIVREKQSRHGCSSRSVAWMRQLPDS